MEIFHSHPSLFPAASHSSPPCHPPLWFPKKQTPLVPCVGSHGAWWPCSGAPPLSSPWWTQTPSPCSLDEHLHGCCSPLLGIHGCSFRFPCPYTTSSNAQQQLHLPAPLSSQVPLFPLAELQFHSTLPAPSMDVASPTSPLRSMAAAPQVPWPSSPLRQQPLPTSLRSVVLSARASQGSSSRCCTPPVRGRPPTARP